jgi:hypothetical protein
LSGTIRAMLMQSLRASWGKVRIFLEAIKFEHTIFALPFALLDRVL